MLKEEDVNLENINQIIIKQENIPVDKNQISLVDIKSNNKNQVEGKNKFDILIEIPENSNESNKESAEKLQRLLNELKKYNIAQHNKSNKKPKISNNMEFNPENKLTKKEQPTIKDVLNKVKELDKKQLNKIRKMLAKKINNNKTNQHSKLISKIKVSNNSQLNENIKIEKILTEINKFTNKEIKTIQKDIVKQINTNSDKKQTPKSHNIKNKNLKTDQILKDKTKQKNTNNNNKHNKNINLNLKENNYLKSNNKSAKIKNIKVEGDSLKDTSQVKIDNKAKGKITFNNLEFELKNKETNKKYKKVNNLKFFSKKQNNQGKENITRLKIFDIKNISNKQNSTIQFKNMIKANNVLDQIKDKVDIKNLSNKNQQIEIKLKPASLGKMKINLSMESNKIVGKILVENNLVQNYLENNLQELKSNLLSKGLQVDQFNIESETKDFNQNQNNQNSQNYFQQFREGHEKNRHKRQSNIYNFLKDKELTEENAEQIAKPGWRTLKTPKGGFEYFA